MHNVSNSNSTFKPHILGRHFNKALSFIPTTTGMDPTASPKDAGFLAELWLLVFEDVYSETQLYCDIYASSPSTSMA